MKKAFIDTKIDRPVFSDETISFNVEELADINEIFWSLDSVNPVILFDEDDITIDDKQITLNFSQHRFNPYQTYYLLANTIDGVPVRFTFDGIEMLLPYEVHFDVETEEDDGLKTDLFINPFGNIAIQKVTSHILDTDIKRLPIYGKMTDFVVSSDDITADILIQYDQIRFDITPDMIRPVFVAVNDDETKISRINDFKVGKVNNDIHISLSVLNVVNLLEFTNYSFAFIVKMNDTKNTLLVNRVSENVFEKVHPFTREEFLLKNNIVTLSWFDKEGIIIERHTSKDLLQKEKLRFDGEFKFDLIESQSGKLEVSQQYKDFEQKWIGESSYRKF
ncbi:hypothetical protein [Pseudolactococcus insecticola]|uniref:Uncharacterized protein n=1 Tax=Pseudolactococcus insecticola TaxID=2709158 RepID=A0A6A0B5I5_9LACT|nr:hypothetical protein [Lactococcus insecticola]GFH39801.1 hypothetical protein Hs20B_01990 [Lactococcus insecticola]